MLSCIRTLPTPIDPSDEYIYTYRPRRHPRGPNHRNAPRIHTLTCSASFSNAYFPSPSPLASRLCILYPQQHDPLPPYSQWFDVPRSMTDVRAYGLLCGWRFAFAFAFAFTLKLESTLVLLISRCMMMVLFTLHSIVRTCRSCIFLYTFFFD